MSTQPAVCPAIDSSDIEAKAGLALFNAPQLLGGQAARAGVSCASCHSNGRRNAYFYLDGVSRDPGTADVSSSFFSPARANAEFDPKPIPDLTRPGKISRDPTSPQLERFLRGLIVEEFAGHEPSQPALHALATYVRSLRACPDKESEVRSISNVLAVIESAVLGASQAARANDDQTASVLISSARHQLGLIDERMIDASLAADRKRLLMGSRELERIDRAQRIDPEALGKWLSRFTIEIEPRLRRHEPRSLYNPVRLKRWLNNAQH